VCRSVVSCSRRIEYGRERVMKVNETRTRTEIIGVVDDDEFLREALGSVLKAAGLSARTFASAEEFLACKDCNDTVCLVLDVRLPGMSGIELQKHLRQSHSHLPIIFITGHGDASLGDSLMRTGASAFLSKPVRSDVLLREIGRALSTRSEKNPDCTD
jgi:two-component system, LuxR family, response regulator FixJ